MADARLLRGDAPAAVALYREINLKKESVDPQALKSDPRDLKKELIASLYETPPKGFENALNVAAKLESFAAANDPLVQVWIACAYGQKYRWLKNQSAPAVTQGDLKGVKDKALEAVKKVIALAPNANAYERTLLKEVLNPARQGSNPSENDLEVFKDDPTFEPAIFG